MHGFRDYAGPGSDALDIQICLSLSFHICKMETVVNTLRVASGRWSLLNNSCLPSLLRFSSPNLARSTELRDLPNFLVIFWHILVK